MVSASSSAASSSSSPNLDLFARQAEIYRAKQAAELAKQAAEEHKVSKLQEAEMSQLQGTVDLMMQSDNETFLALAKSEPKLPGAFLKTSKGVNNFLKRFFVETSLTCDRDNLRMLSETEQWQEALRARGQDESPLDITLTNVGLSNRQIEGIAKFLPNIRTLSVKGYVYQDKTVALNIRELVLARFPKLQKLEMTGGYLLGSIEWERKKVRQILHAQELKTKIKNAEDLRVYFPEKTKSELAGLFVEMQKELTPKAQFYRDTATNIAVNRRLARKVLSAIEPIVINPQAAEKPAAAAAGAQDAAVKELSKNTSKDLPAEAAAKPVSSEAEDPDTEWDQPDEADWDAEASKPADEDW